VLTFGGLAGAAQAGGHRYVATKGSDRNPCTHRLPCRSFERAYSVARPGSTVVVRRGSYASQRLTFDLRKESGRDVVIRAAQGGKVTVRGSIDVLARHVELRGFHTHVWAVRTPAADVTMRSVSADHFLIAGATDVSVLGGVLGPGKNATNLITTASAYGINPSQGVLLDGVTFRSYHGTGGYSARCLQVDGVTELVVRESRFSDCDDGGLFFASRGPAGAPTDVTLENNVIVCCRSGADAVRLDGGSGERWSSFLVRNNSTTGAFTIAPESSTLFGLEFSSNVAESFTGCGRPGVSAEYNVWSTGSPCGAGDAVAAADFQDPEHGNLHPLPGSAAIDRSPVGTYATHDFTNLTRPIGPAGDAGAYESRYSGLVAAYPFEEGAGPGTADVSGNGHTGSIDGAAWTTSGRFGDALRFDGAGDWVTVPDAGGLDLTNEMTLEAWVRPDALGTVWRTVALKEQPGSLVYALYANAQTNGPNGHAFVGGDMDVGSTSRLPVKRWTHVATTYDGSRLQLYVNGATVGSRPLTGSLTTSTGALRIGGNAVWDEWFSGTIDDVRVYNRAIGPKDVKKDMRSSLPDASDTQPPSVPGSLSKSGSTQTSVSLTWTASNDDTGVTGYSVYRDGASAGTPAGTSSTVSGLSCGTSYLFAVEARDAAGNHSAQATLSASTSACPVPDTQPPSVPGSLSKSGSTQTSVSLTWTASNDDTGVTGYSVYRDGASAGTPAGTSSTVSGLSCGTSYLFAVEARDAAGNHSAQATLSASTDSCSSSSANLFLSPTGSDGNPCSRVAPCLSLNRAYRVAKPGDVVEVAGGTYGNQTVNFDSSKTSTADVVFQAAAGATPSFGSADFYSGHITLDALAFRNWTTWDKIGDFTFRDVHAQRFYIFGSRDVSLLGGDYGPSPDAYSFITAPNVGASVPTNILIDGVRFHDYTRSSDSVHTECLHAVSVQGLTVRNSRFERCAVMDFFLTINPNSTLPFRNVLIENNFFGKTIGGGYYSAYFDQRVRFENVQFRNNSLAQLPIFESGSNNYTSFSVTGNVGEQLSFMCNSQVAYSYNVWYSSATNAAKCGSTDVALNGTSDPGWVDKVAVDLHLEPGSAAIDRGGSSCPATDIDGDARSRGAACDAGADES
jgi:chitodextrinase